jgi:hypothetical protein
MAGRDKGRGIWHGRDGRRGISRGRDRGRGYSEDKIKGERSVVGGEKEITWTKFGRI